MTDVEQKKITVAKETIPFNGGVIILSPPNSGVSDKTGPWSHDWKVEVMQGKQKIVLAQQEHIDSLIELLSARRIQSFKIRMPRQMPSSALDEDYIPPQKFSPS